MTLTAPPAGGPQPPGGQGFPSQGHQRSGSQQGGLQPQGPYNPGVAQQPQQQQQQQQVNSSAFFGGPQQTMGQQVILSVKWWVHVCVLCVRKTKAFECRVEKMRTWASGHTVLYRLLE